MVMVETYAYWAIWLPLADWKPWLHSNHYFVTHFVDLGPGGGINSHDYLFHLAWMVCKHNLFMVGLALINCMVLRKNAWMHLWSAKNMHSNSVKMASLDPCKVLILLLWKHGFTWECACQVTWYLNVHESWVTYLHVVISSFSFKSLQLPTNSNV